MNCININFYKHINDKYKRPTQYCVAIRIIYMA